MRGSVLSALADESKTTYLAHCIKLAVSLSLFGSRYFLSSLRFLAQRALASRESFFLAARLIVGLGPLTCTTALLVGTSARRYAAIPASKARSSADNEALFCNSPSKTSLILCFLPSLGLYYMGVRCALPPSPLPL